MTEKPAGSSVSDNPWTVSAKIELAMVGTSTPTELVRALASEPATRFGTYPSSRIARSTLARVSGATCPGSRTTRLTVIEETPASLATADSVGGTSELSWISGGVSRFMAVNARIRLAQL